MQGIKKCWSCISLKSPTLILLMVINNRKLFYCDQHKYTKNIKDHCLDKRFESCTTSLLISMAGEREWIGLPGLPFSHSFIHSFSKCLLSLCNVPGIMKFRPNINHILFRNIHIYIYIYS